MNLIKLSLNCIISTIIYNYLHFFSWEVTKTACQVVRFFVRVKAPLWGSHTSQILQKQIHPQEKKSQITI